MDSHDDRVKRPEPQRTRPVRNWWTLFGPPGSVPPSGPGMPGMPPLSGMPGMPPMPGMPRPPAGGDPVSQGVQMGYRVIEEYMRQGQNVARMFGMPYPGGTMPGFAAPGFAAPGGPPMEVLFRSFSEFMNLWMQMMGGRAPGAAPTAAAPAVGTAGPFAMGEPPVPAPVPQQAPVSVPQQSEGGQVALTLELESPRRTEVSFDLRPRSLGLPLVVHDLRAPEADKPRITGVGLETVPDEERLVLRLRIPAEQPPGIYSGIILDERTSLPRGTLTVRLAP